MAFYYKNVASDATSSGGSAEDPVATFAALPVTGNTDGDLRATLDTHQLYIWNEGGGVWTPVGAGAVNSFQTLSTPLGTSPVADSSTDTLLLLSSDSSVSITGSAVADSIDFVLPSTIPGAKTFSSDLSVGNLTLNTLASAVLLDNTAVAANAFSYAKTNDAVVLEYSLSRDSNRKIGRVLLVNDGASVIMSEEGAEVSPIGVILSAIISGANVVVQYTTTSNGFNSSLKYAIRRWLT